MKNVQMLCVAALLTSAAPALAQEAPQSNPRYSAEYRIWGEAVDTADFEERDEDTETGVFQRLSAGFQFDMGKLSLNADIQALTGDFTDGGIYVDPPDERAITGTRPRGGIVEHQRNIIDPYSFYLTWRPGVAEIRAGLQRSDFGQGLLANGGIEREWDLFNQKFGADRSFRVLAATAPFAIFSRKRMAKKVFFGVGGDLVFRDDNANLIEGDRAWQGVASLFYRDQNPARPDESTFLGIYVAHRNQVDREIDGVTPDDELIATGFDLSAHKSFTIADDTVWVQLAGEAALLVGESTRAYTNESLNDRSEIVAAGAVGDAIVRWKPYEIAFRLMTGYASGDANPDDDTLYRFRFDPNYKVGLVLYDHYLPAATRVAYDRIDDPERSGQPPRGVFGLVSDGAIENTMYLNPQFLLGDPEGLLSGVGVVWAWSAEPLADPYNSFAAGGVPAGINGRREASRQLGVEVDVAARYRVAVWRQLKIEGKVEYGILFPGAAFEDAAGNAADPTSVIRGRVALMW